MANYQYYIPQGVGVVPIAMTEFRVWDAQQTNLPGTAANDDLAIIGGTFGTAGPVLQTADAKTTTKTQYARCQVKVPSTYCDGATISVAINAGMVTTVSDGTATVDLEVYLNGAGSDICATAAQSINSLTAATKTFDITETAICAGDLLDIRVTLAVTDSASGTAVIGQINSIKFSFTGYGA